MDDRRPKLRWSQEADGHLLIKHRVRWETLDAILDAEDLSLVGTDSGRLLLQGTVNARCCRVVVEVLDRKQWILEPLTSCRHAAGDVKQGGRK